METTQLLLIVVIIVLTSILLVLGIQAFLVLRDFRRTVAKANFLMDEVKSGTNIAKIVGTVVALVAGNKFGKNFVDLISGQKDKKPEKPQNTKNTDLIKIELKEPRKVIKRFFRRSKSL